MEQFAAELYAELQVHGFRTRERSVRDISVDSIKFFLKQQQKVLEDNRTSNRMGIKIVPIHVFNQKLIYTIEILNNCDKINIPVIIACLLYFVILTMC